LPVVLELKINVPVIRYILAAAERILQEHEIARVGVAAAVGQGHEGPHRCCARVAELKAEIVLVCAELEQMHLQLGEGAPPQQSWVSGAMEIEIDK
jgi:hypothetical protein